MMPFMSRWRPGGPAGLVVGLALGGVLLLPGAAARVAADGPPAVVQDAPDVPTALRRVVDDYVGLYRRETLDEWRTLFLPSFTSLSTNADGTVTVRTLDQFFDAQVRGFARATEMSETLEHVRIDRTGRLATAWADFVFHQNGTSRRGRLVLTLAETEGAWRIAGLLFSY